MTVDRVREHLHAMVAAVNIPLNADLETGFAADAAGVERNVHRAVEAGVAGNDYSIADIAIFSWVRNLVGFYAAGELVELSKFGNVQRALDAFVARPAVQRGLTIPA